MDVIKRRNNHLNKQAIVICRNCGSTLRVFITDGKYIDDQRDGSYVQTNCANCGHYLTVASHLFKSPKEPSAEDYYNK